MGAMTAVQLYVQKPNQDKNITSPLWGDSNVGGSIQLTKGQ